MAFGAGFEAFFRLVVAAKLRVAMKKRRGNLAVGARDLGLTLS